MHNATPTTARTFFAFFKKSSLFHLDTEGGRGEAPLGDAICTAKSPVGESRAGDTSGLFMRPSTTAADSDSAPPGLLGVLSMLQTAAKTAERSASRHASWRLNSFAATCGGRLAHTM